MRARDALYRCLPLSLVVGLGAACEEDALTEIHPLILVCHSEEAADADCNKAIDLGERFITVEHTVPLSVRNRGEAPLSVSSISSTVAWALAEPETLDLGVGAEALVEVRLTPEQLGAQELNITFASDDPERPVLQVPLRFEGTPKPVPVLELCVLNLDGVNAGAETCGTELELDFGLVRRGQGESRSIAVRNVGTAALNLEEVVINDQSSVAGELAVATSTRAGSLAAGEEAHMLIVYEPADGAPDAMTLTFVSDDPAAPEAVISLLADSDENLAPTALAAEHGTGLRSLEATVGDVVVLDGGGSSDPEGDPLLYQWTLTVPASSLAELDDAAAGRVSFLPDVAGTYRAELVVTDSLGQASQVASDVLVQAVPGAALRVRLSWTQGGDVDLHFVPLGDTLFTPTDAYFGNPRPDLGSAGDPLDDPELLSDAEGAPGVENLVFVAPPTGSFRVYAHYYDEAGAGPAIANVSVTINDASFPVLDDTRTLQAGCALWQVADIELPAGIVSNTGAGISSLCP